MLELWKATDLLIKAKVRLSVIAFAKVVEDEEEFGRERFLCAEKDANVSADPSSTLGNKGKCSTLR